MLGRYEEAVRTLRRGLEEFPPDPVLGAFPAMGLYNLGRSREALGPALKALAATSGDPGVREYRRAIEHYADDLGDVRGAGRVSPRGTGRRAMPQGVRGPRSPAGGGG